MKKLPLEFRQKLTRYYQTADKYGERIDAHGESAYQEYISFVKHFTDKKDRILDLGCGTGLTTSMLSGFVKEVIGIDVSSMFIQKAKEKRRAPNIKFICADILNLPFPDESYDIVSSFQVIEHLCDIERAFSEMVRVTKRGGLIIILSPNLLSPIIWLYGLANAASGKKNKLFPKERCSFYKAIYSVIYNSVLLLRKNLSGKYDFIYRLPVLENRFDAVADDDAVYLSNPVDLKFWFRSRGLKIIKYQRQTKGEKICPSFATGIHLVVRKG